MQWGWNLIDFHTSNFISEGEKGQTGTDDVIWGGVAEPTDDRDKTLTSPSENPFTGATENPFASQISGL